MFEIAFLVFATIVFLGFMAKRMIESLFTSDSAIISLRAVLDDVRYIIAFIGAIVAQLLIYEALDKFFKQYDMPPIMALTVQVTMFVFTIVYSASISGGIIHSERAIGEGNLTPRKFLALLIILGIFIPMEWNSLVLGLERGFKTLEEYRIDKVSQISNIDKISIDSRASLVRINQKRIKQIDELLSDKENISFEPDDEYKKISRDYNWCVGKYKNKSEQMCARLKSLLNAKEIELKKRAEAKLIKERNFLVAQINKALEQRDKKITQVKQEQQEKTLEIKKQTLENNELARKIVTVMLFIGFAVSILRSMLGDDVGSLFIDEEYEEEIQKEEKVNNNEYKPIKKVSLSKKELQEKYVVAAMQQYARSVGYRPDEYGHISSHSLKFPRDDIVRIAKTLAAEDGILLQLGNSTASKLINSWDVREEVGEWIKENLAPFENKAA